MRNFKRFFWLAVIVNMLSASLLTVARSANAQVNSVGLCCAYVVKSGIRFAWVRTEPSSTGRVISTLYPGDLVVTALPWDNSTLSSDGAQYWLKVCAKNGTVTGWIEDPSLVVAPPSRTPRQTRAVVADWLSTIRVRAGVRFVWLRAYPSSSSRALYTSYSGYNLYIVGKPVADNRQWWWPVRSVSFPNEMGWVEQNSLESETQGPLPTTIRTQPSGDGQFNSFQVKTAFQQFERGFMLWRSDDRVVYVMKNDGVVLLYFPNQYEPLPDNPLPDVPPAGRFKPISGFGRVWGNLVAARDVLGWALGAEQGYMATVRTPIFMLRYYLITLPDNRQIQIGTSTGGSSWQYSSQ